MSTINDGGPANEMSLRAYFAAHAPVTYADAIEKLGKSVCRYDAIRWLVESKSIYADRMIAAMERKA